MPKLSHWTWNLLMQVDQKVSKSRDPSVPAHPVLRSQVTAVCFTWVLEIRLKSWRLRGKRLAARAVSSAPFCSSHVSDAISFLRGPHRIKTWSLCGIQTFVILSLCLSTLISLSSHQPTPKKQAGVSRPQNIVPVLGTAAVPSAGPSTLPVPGQPSSTV